MLEGYLERANWDTGASSVTTPGSRSLDEGDLMAIMFAANTSPATEYIKNDITIPTAPTATTATATILDTLSASVPIEAATFERPLKPDEVRKMYLNLKRLTRTHKAVLNSDVATAWTQIMTYTRSDGTTQVNPSADAWNNIFHHRKGSPRQGSTYQAITISYNASFGTFPYATAAWLLLKTDAYAEDAAAHFYDVTGVPCTVTNGAVSVPSVTGIAQSICLAHGINSPTAPAYIQSGGGQISILEYMLVVDNEFPAEVNSLDWNWSPPQP